MPSPGTKGVRRGYLIPIGGAEQRLENPKILSRFTDLCGGSDARIAVIPTASKLENTGQSYVEIFRDLGAKHAISLAINERSDTQSAAYLKALDKASGIFITGGNQLRLSTILGGTPVAQAIRRLNAAGTHVAGTSAGAAIMPEHMISGGDPGATPKQGLVSLSPGLGLTNAVVIDQHFRQRDRLGRLMAAIAFSPFLVGLGVDEDTAAFIDPDGVIQVVGAGAVTVIDPRDLEYSSMDSAGRGESLSMIGIRVHILAHGCRYKLSSGKASFPQKEST